MIASLASNSDIDIFLNRQEIQELEKASLEGTIIHSEDPKLQGKIILYLGSEGVNLRSKGVDVKREKRKDIDLGTVVVKLFAPYLKDVVNQGLLGLRYDGLGSKVSFYNLDLNTTARHGADNLNFYKENRQRFLDSTKK